MDFLIWWSRKSGLKDYPGKPLITWQRDLRIVHKLLRWKYEPSTLRIVFFWEIQTYFCRVIGRVMTSHQHFEYVMFWNIETLYRRNTALSLSFIAMEREVGPLDKTKGMLDNGPHAPNIWMCLRRVQNCPCLISTHCLFSAFHLLYVYDAVWTKFYSTRKRIRMLSYWCKHNLKQNCHCKVMWLVRSRPVYVRNITHKCRRLFINNGSTLINVMLSWCYVLCCRALALLCWHILWRYDATYALNAARLHIWWLNNGTHAPIYKALLLYYDMMSPFVPQSPTKMSSSSNLYTSSPLHFGPLWKSRDM